MPKWTKEQQSAIDLTGSNIIVSAGAGSGKTAVLTARVGRILMSGIHIDQLLILTFTKAAAAEMKERIRKYIKNNPELKSELELIDSAYITTFDSFALSVVKKYHYLLNISNNIAITDSSIIDIKKKQIMDQVFAEYYAVNNQSFINMINSFCVKDDKNLTSAFLNIAKSLELLPNKIEYLHTYLDNYFNSVTIDNLINEYFQLLKNKVNEIKLAIEDYKHLISTDYYTKLLDSISYLVKASTINEIITASNIKLPQLPRGSEEEVKEYKEKQLAPLLKELQSLASYGTEETIRQNILTSKDTIKVIVQILLKYFQELEKYKLENEIYDFQDIALLAIKIVAEFPDARAELKNKFKEIMIDEYQDTNDIQETFISYIENNNVYMVGDIKQSIYRFRNANPYIFKNKYDVYSLSQGGQKIDLLKNFRSRKEVLANINLIFCAVMDDFIGGADYIATHQMIYGNMTYSEAGNTKQDYNLRILTYPKSSEFSNEEIEIFAIAKDIKEKITNNYQVFDKDSETLRNASYSDFVILMDRATNFELYKKIFEYLNIPLTIYKDEKLNDSDELLIIKNALVLTTCIHQKKYDVHFRYAFTSIARSFLYEFIDQDIFNCFANNNFYENTIFKDFSDIANQLSNLNTKQILELIINKTKYYQKLIKIGDIESSTIRVTKLLELADNLTASGYDIYDFIEYLENISQDGLDLKYSTGTTSEDSVKIMTIHKSKGLEYHICYYSGLYKKFNIGDIKEKFLYNNKYGLIAPIFDEGIAELITKELVKADYLNEEISEKIRLFYVGLTRAKEQIIILLPETDNTNSSHREEGIVNNIIRTKYRSFASIIYSIEDLLKSYIEKLNIESLNLSKNYLYNKELETKIPSSNDYIQVEEINIPNETLTENSFSKKIKEPITKDIYNNIELGLKIHEILEYIDFQNYDENQIEDKFIANKITNLMNHEIMQNIQDATIYKEHEFIYEKDNQLLHGIIDLMLEYENHIDIIDYKLNNIEDEKYLAQLKGYQEYIEKITNKKTSLYLYSILQGTILAI